MHNTSRRPLKPSSPHSHGESSKPLRSTMTLVESYFVTDRDVSLRRSWQGLIMSELHLFMRVCIEALALHCRDPPRQVASSQ